MACLRAVSPSANWRQANEMIQERAFYQFQSPVQIKVLLLTIYKRNISAPPSHSSVVTLPLVVGSVKFLIATGIPAFAGSSWGLQLLLMIGVQ